MSTSQSTTLARSLASLCSPGGRFRVDSPCLKVEAHPVPANDRTLSGARPREFEAALRRMLSVKTVAKLPTLTGVLMLLPSVLTRGKDL